MKKNKSILIIIFLIVPFFGAIAQGGFKKRHFIQNAYNADCRDVIEAPNGNLIATGIITDSILGAYKLCLLGMDSVGNILWKKIYGNSNYLYYNNDMHVRGPVIYDSTGIYQAFCATDSSFKKQFGVLLKYDYNGDTLWQKKYTFPDTVQDIIPQALAFSVDGGILITGHSQHWGGGGGRCIVIKTDIKGNELWRKLITKSQPNVQDGKSIVQDRITKKIVIVGYQYQYKLPYTFDMEFGVTSNILLLDSLGNQPIRKTLNNYNGGGFTEVIQLKDNNFLTCGAVNLNSDLGNFTRTKSLIVKFDISGSIIWKQEYDTLSPFNCAYLLRELDNGDILSLSWLDTLLNHGLSEEIRIKVSKFDSQGNRIWHRYIGARTDEIPRSLNPTKDGGFVIAVRDVTTPAPNPFSIIKIDSNGCDTLEAYCRYIDALSINDLSRFSSNKLQLFPNPAQDHVQIKIDGQADYEFDVIVCDISGRQLKSIKIKPGEKPILKTTTYPSGLYLLRLENEGRILENKKLVIVR